jgi:saccharopine dehydrogenase-like NADP-dependent oxidoreductase
MKRVALLGATGSIGRQAIEIIAAHPDLELAAAASATTPLDDIDAPRKQVGGDLTELLERAEPDVVLNAVVGFAGIHATLWTLEHGIDLALATRSRSSPAASSQRGSGAASSRSTPSTPRSSSASRGRAASTRSCSPAPAARSAGARATSCRM